MNMTVKQLHIEYQTHSLIEFLLGDGTRPGWLDMRSGSQSSSAELRHETNLFRDWRPIQ